jgi:glucan 1,3-beta-glucosidase
MLKGVNLGNWLVLEKWMSPQLFAGTSAEDELHLCSELSEVAKQEHAHG